LQAEISLLIAWVKLDNPGVIAETIREMLDRDPFGPFRIVTSSGQAYVIRDPHLVALMKSQVFIAEPKSDRRSFVPRLDVTTVQSLGNGKTAPRKRPA